MVPQKLTCMGQGFAAACRMQVSRTAALAFFGRAGPVCPPCPHGHSAVLPRPDVGTWEFTGQRGSSQKKHSQEAARARGCSFCGRRGTAWKFQSKELCESLRFHSKSERARPRNNDLTRSLLRGFGGATRGMLGAAVALKVSCAHHCVGSNCRMLCLAEMSIEK